MANPSMDAFLADLPEPQRSTLQLVRSRIHEAFPAVEECFSYGVPAFRIDGVVVAGLAARKNGCSYYPMSGSLLDGIDLAALGYTRTKGALQFPADEALPIDLLRELITTRLAQR